MFPKLLEQSLKHSIVQDVVAWCSITIFASLEPSQNMFQHSVNPVRKARSKKSWFAKVGVEEPKQKSPAQSPDLNPTYGMNWNIICTPDHLTPASAPDLTDAPLSVIISEKNEGENLEFGVQQAVMVIVVRCSHAAVFNLKRKSKKEIVRQTNV